MCVDLPCEDPNATFSDYAEVAIDAWSAVDDDLVVVGHFDAPEHALEGGVHRDADGGHVNYPFAVRHEAPCAGRADPAADASTAGTTFVCSRASLGASRPDSTHLRVTVSDVVAGDMTDPDSVSKAMEDCDSVLHPAARFTFDSRKPSEIVAMDERRAIKAVLWP